MHRGCKNKRGQEARWDPDDSEDLGGANVAHRAAPCGSECRCIVPSDRLRLDRWGGAQSALGVGVM